MGTSKLNWWDRRTRWRLRTNRIAQCLETGAGTRETTILAINELGVSTSQSTIIRKMELPKIDPNFIRKVLNFNLKKFDVSILLFPPLLSPATSPLIQRINKIRMSHNGERNKKKERKPTTFLSTGMIQIIIQEQFSPSSHSSLFLVSFLLPIQSRK